MNVLGLALLLVCFGCGGKRTVGAKGSKTPTTKADPDSDPQPGDPSIGRSERLDLEFSTTDERDGFTQVSLILTNETGSSQRRKLSEYPGECKRIALNGSPGSGVAGELLAAQCTQASGGGRDLRFVVRQGLLVTLESRWDNPEAERSYEQRGSMALPTGATIEAEPMEGEASKGEPSQGDAESTEP